MSTERNRNCAVSVLHAHQPDDLNTGHGRVACTCGEQLPVRVPVGDAIAVHQAFALVGAGLLRNDPTGPLSVSALADVGAGEVVFDAAGIPWINKGRVAPDLLPPGPQVWGCYHPDAPAPELCDEDLLVERGPLSLHRPVEVS